MAGKVPVAALVGNGVNRVALTVRRTLPVFPRHRQQRSAFLKSANSVIASLARISLIWIKDRSATWVQTAAGMDTDIADGSTAASCDRGR